MISRSFTRSTFSLVHIAFVAIAILMGSCRTDTTSDPSTEGGKIIGRVLDGGTFQPVGGVQITTVPPTSSILTADDGTFTISGVAAGRYTVYGAKPGVGNGSVSILVEEGKSTQTEFYLSHIPDATGLIAAYQLNGDASDISGEGHDGTLEGAPTFGTDRFGHEGSAIHFTNYDQRVRVPHSQVLNSFPLSMTMWMKFDGPPNPDALLIGKYLHPSGEGYSLFTDNYEFCGSSPRANFTRYARACGQLLEGNRWYFIAVVYSINGTTVYVDGEEYSHSGWVGSPSATNNTQDFMMGQLESYTLTLQQMEFLNGYLDDVYIYGRALTAGEIADLEGK